jgi:plasmid maintenance system antidote protein VapI
MSVASRPLLVFGSSAIYWMNLEAIWQLYRLNEKKKTAARRKKHRMAHESETYSVPASPIVAATTRPAKASGWLI